MENKTNKRKSGMVKLRGGFSDQHNLVEINKIQQIDEFDDDTRIRLNNKLYDLLEVGLDSNALYTVYLSPTTRLANIGHYFSKEILEGPLCIDARFEKGAAFVWRKVYDGYISKIILSATYNEVLDIVQYCCQWMEREICSHGRFYNEMNTFFEQEYIGYRFSMGYIIPITDETELQEISGACKNPYEGARSHMKKAVQYLSVRTIKDYKNCIKESISAVESICQIITGNAKATLGDALKVISKNNYLHPALKEGFSKLYGYTSDQGGIRHAEGLFESNVTFDEAKYFLVSCSAFVNYLIAEYAKGAN